MSFGDLCLFLAALFGFGTLLLKVVEVASQVGHGRGRVAARPQRKNPRHCRGGGSSNGKAMSFGTTLIANPRGDDNRPPNG